ncbi:MAG: sugar phosphate isomerase/epimerase family protein, partial [Planctomycetia bacterium]
MDATSRRRFLRTAAVGVAAAACPATAIEPLKRATKTPLRLGLAAYSLRESLLAKPGKPATMDLAGFVDYAAGVGFDAVELTSYYFPNPVADEYLATLKRRCHLAGLDVSGGAIRNDFCLPPGKKRDETIAETKKWVEWYAKLGAPTIRVFAGKVAAKDSEEASLQRCIEGLQETCDYAGKFGLILGLENHGGITARAETMLKIVKGVDSPWLGVNLDSGNFRDGPDPYAELEMIAPYAVNAQVKVAVSRNKTDKKEPTDLRRVVDILRKADYAGYVVLEYE